MPDIKPAKGWLALPIGALVIAVALIAVGLVGLLSGLGGNQSLENGKEILIDEAGNYEICYEYNFAYDLNADIQFAFADEAGNISYSDFPSYSSTYTVGGTSGVVIGVVPLEPGAYTVQYDQGHDLDFILRKGSFSGTFAGIFGLAIGIVLLVFAIIALIILLLVRSHNRQRLQRQYPHDYK